jgi:hypothetical protein
MQPNNSAVRPHAVRPRFPTAALTLVELVVVLVVIAAVATLVAHLGGSLIQRSAGVSGATTASELVRVIGTYHARTGRYPDGFDSLIQAPYTLYSAIPTAARRQLKPKDLDNADRAILAAEGISTTWMHAVPGSEPVTWQETTGNKAFDASAGGFASDDVAALDTSRIDPNSLFGPGIRRNTVNESFVLFGLGSRCTLVGPGADLAQAPVMPPTSAALHPSENYMRFALVFRLDRDDARPLRFLGVVGFGEKGVQTVPDFLRAWWR